MSNSDEGPTTGVKAARPIVLAFDCPEGQQYLCAENKVLEALYGQPPERVDISTEHLGPELFSQYSDELLVALFRRYPKLTYGTLNEFLRSEEFTDNVWRAIDLVGVSHAGPDWERRVNVILVRRTELFDYDGLRPIHPLPTVFQKYLPQAEVFLFQISGRGTPQSLTEALITGGNKGAEM